VVQCVAVCCSVLQCVAVCCSVLQRVAACCSVGQCGAVCCSVLQCVAVYCSVLQCVAVRCSVVAANGTVLHCLAECSSLWMIGLVCVFFLPWFLVSRAFVWVLYEYKNEFLCQNTGFCMSTKVWVQKCQISFYSFFWTVSEYLSFFGYSFCMNTQKPSKSLVKEYKRNHNWFCFFSF